jgi:hypothetical protein
MPRCWVVDLIYGPEPPTPADEKRDADRERLRRAFPNIDNDGSIAVADAGQQVQATPTTTVMASMKSRPYPWRRFIGTQPEQALRSLDPEASAPPGHERRARVGSRR